MFFVVCLFKVQKSTQSHKSPSFFFTNNTGDTYGEELVWIKPQLRRSSSCWQSLSISASNILYVGLVTGVESGRRSMQWSIDHLGGRDFGSLLGKTSAYSFRISYTFGSICGGLFLSISGS